MIGTAAQKDVPIYLDGLGQVQAFNTVTVKARIDGYLEQHINAYIKAYNERAEPFAWTKKKVYQRKFKNRRITQL